MILPRILSALAGLAMMLAPVLAGAQGLPTFGPGSFGPNLPPPGPPEPPPGVLYMSAVLGASETQPVRGGLKWRVFEERAQPDGTHKMVAESDDAAPRFSLPAGGYIVHAAFGLAGAAKRIVLDARPVTDRIVLNAGALKIATMLGDQPIPPQKISISIYVPAPGNSEAKLVVDQGKPGDMICLPEGQYHIVSTLYDLGNSTTSGSASATNSIVTTDLRVQVGKATQATLKHRAATMTLKLVNQPGGEALANTSFSVLTPGGDVIRELIGAFPALVLAEGEYVAIARHEGKTYQAQFKVQSTLDRDVEVVAK
ncbi:MAG TPA: hypothetical protein PKA55_07405 [Rhodoblastus sp.]|nr:hypothetical protein [Rhodoblastus sp.]